MQSAAASKRSAQVAVVAALIGLAAGGCSSAPTSLGAAGPSYLGAGNTIAPNVSKAPLQTRVSSGKVLSAIVFERVTGLEVDPARLVQP